MSSDAMNRTLGPLSAAPDRARLNIVNTRLFFGVKAGRGVLVGASIGAIGMYFLFAPRISEISFSDSVFFGSSLALLAALSASFGNIVSQKIQKADIPVVQMNTWGMFYGAVFMAIVAVVNGRDFTFEWSAAYVTSLAYLTIFGSIVAFGAYLTLLGRIGAHKAGYAMVMFPVVALLLSALFEGLAITPPTIAGTLLVLVGNVFVLRTKRTATGGQADADVSACRRRSQPVSICTKSDFS